MKTLYTTISLFVLSVTVSAQHGEFSDFTLPSATDSSHFTLSNARGSFVVLHFLLKTECPYCIRHTREYLKKGSSLLGVQQLFIKPDTEQEIREWAVKASPSDSLPFPVYRDADAALAERYHIPGGYRFHGQVVHYPALILLNANGTEVFRYVGKSNADRFPFDSLAAKVKALRGTAR